MDNWHAIWHCLRRHLRYLVSIQSSNIVEKVSNLDLLKGCAMSLLNLPLGFLSLWFDLPFNNFLSDVRQGILYCALLSFWIIFTGEHLLVSSWSSILHQYLRMQTGANCLPPFSILRQIFSSDWCLYRTEFIDLVCHRITSNWALFWWPRPPYSSLIPPNGNFGKCRACVPDLKTNSSVIISEEFKHSTHFLRYGKLMPIWPSSFWWPLPSHAFSILPSFRIMYGSCSVLSRRSRQRCPLCHPHDVSSTKESFIDSSFCLVQHCSVQLPQWLDTSWAKSARIL